MAQLMRPGLQRADCPFCQIARGEGQGVIVFEDEISVAFLDKRPLFPGHTLLIPRDHYETLPDLPRLLVGSLFVNAQYLARAVEEAMEAEGTLVVINNRVSQSVPHLHIHIVPRRKGDGLRGFLWPRHVYADQDAIESVAHRISEALARLGIG